MAGLFNQRERVVRGARAALLVLSQMESGRTVAPGGAGGGDRGGGGGKGSGATRVRRRPAQHRWALGLEPVALLSLLLALLLLSTPARGFGACRRSLFAYVCHFGSTSRGVPTRGHPPLSTNQSTHAHTHPTPSPSYTKTELSCASARVPAAASLEFCAPVVTWRAAAVYAHINYTVRVCIHVCGCTWGGTGGC